MRSNAWIWLFSSKLNTAAVLPTSAITRTLVRQAWDEWPLDRFFPILWHSFYLE